MVEQQHQRQMVASHFRAVSTGWGPRYEGRPRKMSDLDLQLRRENVQRLLEAAAGRTALPMRVVDLGCGAGNVLDHVSRDLVRVIGVDVVPEMVKQAALDHPGDSFLVADASKLPVRPESVDAVTCVGVLEYLTDPLSALNTIWRGLKPGGFLIVSFPNKSSLFRTLSGWETTAERALLQVRDRLLGRPRADSGRPVYSHTQWSVPTAKTMLQHAGFSIESVRLQTFGLWGWVGRMRPALWLSRQLSSVLGREGVLSRRLGCTVVMLARKPSRNPT